MVLPPTTFGAFHQFHSFCWSLRTVGDVIPWLPMCGTDSFTILAFKVLHCTTCQFFTRWCRWWRTVTCHSAKSSGIPHTETGSTSIYPSISAENTLSRGLWKSSLAWCSSLVMYALEAALWLDLHLLSWILINWWQFELMDTSCQEWQRSWWQFDLIFTSCHERTLGTLEAI